MHDNTYIHVGLTPSSIEGNARTILSTSVQSMKSMY